MYNPVRIPMDATDIVNRALDLSEDTTTSDIAPVMVGSQAALFTPPKKAAVKPKPKMRKAYVSKDMAGVLGLKEDEEKPSSGSEESIIPDNAQKLDDAGNAVEVKDDKTENNVARKPNCGPEELLSPRAALVAPDITPDAMTALDPSDVPGSNYMSFKASDAQAPTPQAPSTPAPISSATANTLNLFTQAQTPQRPRFESKVTPEAAAAMFASSGKDLIQEGVPMPDPTPANPTALMNAFRMFR